jgi:hypothetical protein
MGSTFVVTLPVTKAAHPEDLAGTVRRYAAGGG